MSLPGARREPFGSHLASSPDEVAEVLARLSGASAASFPILDAAGCRILEDAASRLAFLPATPVIGEGARRVYQEFDICMKVPPESPFRALGRALEALFDAALAGLDPPPLAPPFAFNDLVVQIYRPGAIGITPHLDHVRYVGLVALVVVCGAGRFYLCDDRAGTGAREVPAPAGHLILMVAPGFAGRRDRPFHMVKEITARRISFGLRHDTRPEGAPSY